MGSDVFISYSRQNSDFARKLIDRLTLKGKDAWVDWEGIPLTSPNWWNEIKLGIEQADSFLFIVSPASMASVVCNMELDYAYALNKRVIPLIYQDVESRDSFASIADFQPDEAMNERLGGKDPLLIARDNWQKLSHINWLFFREDDDFDPAFERLITTVETDLPYVKAHTRYLSHAAEWEREDRRADLLLFGEEIDRAEDWLQKGDEYAAQTRHDDEKVDVINPLPQDLHREYISVSRIAANRRRLQVRVAGGAILALAIALIIGSLAGLLIVSTTQEEANNAQSTGDAAQVLADAANTQVQDGATEVAEQATLVAEAEFAEEVANTQAADAAEREQSANTQVADLEQDQIRLEGEIASSETRLESLRLIELAQRETDVTNNSLGLALAMAANQVENPPGQAQRMLADLAYGTGVVAYLEGHDGSIRHLSLNSNGHYLASSATDGKIIIWDIDRDSDTYLRPLQIIEESVVYDMAFTRNSNLIYVTADLEVVTWNVLTERERDRVQLSISDIVIDDEMVFTSRPREAILSPDGTYVLTTYDEHMFVWEVRSGDLVQQFKANSALDTYFPTFDAAETGIYTTRFGAAFYSESNRVISWDIETGSMVQSIQGVSRSKGFAVNASETRAVSIDAEGFSDSIIWSLENGSIIRSFRDGIMSAGPVIGTNDRYVFTGDDAGRVFIRDLETGELVDAITAHTGDVTTISTRRSFGEIDFITGSGNGEIAIWNLGLESFVGAFDAFLDQELGFNDFVSTVEFDTTGTSLFVADSRGNLLRFTVPPLAPAISLVGHAETIMDMTLSSDGELLYSLDMNGNLLIWQTDDNTLVGEIDLGEDLFYSSMMLHPDGKTMFVSSEAMLTAWVIDPMSVDFGSRNMNVPLTSLMSPISLSPDQTTLAIGGCDGPDTHCDTGKISLIDIATERVISDWEVHDGFVTGIAFLPDGLSVVTTSIDGTSGIWDIITGVELKRFIVHDWAFTNDNGRPGVTDLELSDDWRTAFSIGFEGSLIHWNVNTGEVLRRYGDGSILGGFAVSEEANLFAIAAQDGEISFWLYHNLEELLDWVSTNRYVPEFSCDEQNLYGISLDPDCSNNN